MFSVDSKRFVTRSTNHFIGDVADDKAITSARLVSFRRVSTISVAVITDRRKPIHTRLQ
jgi:hypothetical protein